MFTISKIISDKDGKFCGYRLVNPFGVILDIDERLAYNIFPFISYDDYSYRNIKATEMQKVFESEKVKTFLPILFTKYSRMILGIKKDYIPEIILLDNPKNCINLKSTEKSDYIIRFPLNSEKNLARTIKKLKIAENFIHSRIESTFALDKIFISHIYKDGTIEYELIPMFDKDFDKIFNSCKQICNKYGIIVSHHQVNLYKGFKYDAIALQFNSLIDFKFCNFPTYYSDKGLGYREDATGFFYELGYLKDIIRTDWLTDISQKFLNDYMPINKLLAFNNNNTIYIINGYRTLLNLEKEDDYAYTMIEEEFENQGLLKFISTDKPSVTCQKSYKNTITTFRIPVDYLAIDASKEELCNGIYEEFINTEWIHNYLYEVIDTSIEFLENEIWIYIILEERG